MKINIDLILEVFLKNNKFLAFKKGDSMIIYSNKKCFLKFTKEYADVYLNIINPNQTNEEYHIGIILFSLFNKRIEMFSEIFNPSDRITSQLLNYEKYLNNELKNIIDGDFSWVNKYKAFENMQIELYKKVRELPRNNPIYQKYLNEDMSWKDDIQNI